MKYYKHQRELINQAPKKHLLAWSAGTGKTIAMIKLAENYGLHNALVICPKPIKEQWQTEIRKFAIEPMLFHVLTKEEFKKKSSELNKYNKVIVDEAHYFFMYSSQLHKSLRRYLSKNKPEQVYLGTATPYLSTSWNIYSAGLLLGQNWRWHKWKNYFFYDIKMGRKTIPQEKSKINGKDVKDILAELINFRLGNTVKLEDCTDVPAQVYLEEKFDLTSHQKQAMENLDDVDHISFWTKCHQINGGTLKSDGYSPDQKFKCQKLNRIKELCKEHSKLVVVCRYNHELDYIEENIKNKNVYKINGQTRDRGGTTARADFDPNCVVLVNAACSEGYELPTFSVMVFYSYDFSLKNYIQMKGRIQRINAVKKNVYISLINRGTIDEDVYASIQRKEDFQISIYNK